MKLGKFIVILYNPSNGYPIPLTNSDDDLMVFENAEQIKKDENPLIKSGNYEIFELGAGLDIATAEWIDKHQ